MLGVSHVIPNIPGNQGLLHDTLQTGGPVTPTRKFTDMGPSVSLMIPSVSHIIPYREGGRELPHHTHATYCRPEDPHRYPRDWGPGDCHMIPNRWGAWGLPHDTKQVGGQGTPALCPTDWGPGGSHMIPYRLGARGLPHDTLQTEGTPK